MLAIKMIGNQLQAIFSNMATELFHGTVPNNKTKKKIENEDILVDYQPSDEMVADILTKGLPKLKHYKYL